MKLKIIYLGLYMLFLAACSGNKKHLDDSFDHAYSFLLQYPDVLKFQHIPDEKWPTYCFYDLGAWHGFSIPAEDEPEYHGGFIGPFLLSKKQWLEKQWIQLKLYKGDEYQEWDYGKAVHTSFHAYPGHLSQIITFPEIEIHSTLFFISSASAMVVNTIYNKTKEKISVVPVYQLKTGEKLRFFQNGDYHFAEVGIEDEKYRVSSDLNNIIKEVYNEEAVFSQTQKIAIASGDSVTTSYVLTYLTSPEKPNEILLVRQALKEPNAFFHKNLNRWAQYLQDVLKGDKTKDPGVVKSVMTLVNNWKSSYKNLPYEGIVPSASIHYFNGFWAWDSWKHASAAVLFEPELAKDQVRAMFEYQDTFGMVADCIFPDSANNNWRDTKPPLAGWAVWNVYKKTSDTLFLESMYPRLQKYHDWWYTCRDHDKNGLCEYGSTDGTLVAAAWESGMDNAVRFDHTRMLKNSENAWSMNQESVDLNSYLFLEKILLDSIRQVLGISLQHVHETISADSLKQLIQQRFFDRNSGYFYDVKVGSNEFIPVKGPEGWIPLWTGVATKEQAERVKGYMWDENVFNGYVPLPTLDMGHSELDPEEGYWRGPVWIDQACFGIEGLQKYEYREEAMMLKKKLFEHAEGFLVPGVPIRENYDPLTGKGLEANNFSWSAAHFLLLYMNPNLSINKNF